LIRFDQKLRFFCLKSEKNIGDNAKPLGRQPGLGDRGFVVFDFYLSDGFERRSLNSSLSIR